MHGESGARAGTLVLPELAGYSGECERRRFATARLERWLAECPDGPLAPSHEASPVLTALIDGWDSTAVHALAAGPVTVSDVAEAIGAPRLEPAAAALREMQETELVTLLPEPSGEPYFAPTEWLRRAVGPLAAAARVEIEDPPAGAAPIDRFDVEAAFRLTLPLIPRLDREISHLCRLVVTMPDRRTAPGGVVVLIEQGEIASVSADLTIQSATYAAGPPTAWIETLIDPAAPQLSTGGNLEVLGGLVGGLHGLLYADDRPPTLGA